MTLKQSPYPVVMARLIALDMPASKTFVELVQRVWSNGDAVLPIDQRLPQHGKKLLLDAMSPSEIIDASFDSSAFTLSPNAMLPIWSPILSAIDLASWADNAPEVTAVAN
jgi:hypothetical protein